MARPAEAQAGSARATSDGDGGEEQLHGRASRVTQGAPVHKEIRPHPDRILTDVGAPHLRGFLLTVAASLPLALLAVVAPAGSGPGSPRVLVARLDDDINPVSQHYLQDQVRRAQDGRLRTPSSSSSTPRAVSAPRCGAIVKTFLASSVPVVVYVSPGGSSADSAGAVIGQAADVLAMAPQTNIGSSTPISTERRRSLEGSAAQGRQRCRRLRRPSSRVSTGGTRRRRRRWCGKPPTTARARRPRRTSSTSSRRRCPALLREIDGRVTDAEGAPAGHRGGDHRHGRDVVLAAGARHADRPEHHRADALARRRRDRSSSCGIPGLVLPGTVGAISLARRPLRPAGAAGLRGGRA